MNKKIYYQRTLVRLTKIELALYIKGGDPTATIQWKRLGVYLWRAMLFCFKWMPVFFNILTFRKAYIPNVGFSVTTRCTLKCKHCDHYIPFIEEPYHETISFEEYKTYLDHLLTDAEKIYELRLYGGEPLINKDLSKMLLYSLEHPKTVRVNIVTNGTLHFSDELVSILKQFPAKATVYISNYTANKSLSPLLKTDKIVERLKNEGIAVVCNKQLWWGVTAPLERYYRTKESNIHYFMECLKLIHCYHVRGGKLFVCPRAGTFALRDIYRRFFPPAPEIQENKEYIDLSRPVTKQQLFTLFGNDFFNACDYCNNVAETNGEKVVPALQVESESKVENSQGNC
ncbi:MAG: radical SAM protein [Dysgonamonadaceae bacterium]|jgi:pyruvate-formate lyase-activating enzyme|nr:radical SAM protein [Dysgonamonadaceae bacterium]